MADTFSVMANRFTPTTRKRAEPPTNGVSAKGRISCAFSRNVFVGCRTYAAYLFRGSRKSTFDVRCAVFSPAPEPAQVLAFVYGVPFSGLAGRYYVCPSRCISIPASPCIGLGMGLCFVSISSVCAAMSSVFYGLGFVSRSTGQSLCWLGQSCSYGAGGNAARSSRLLAGHAISPICLGRSCAPNGKVTADFTAEIGGFTISRTCSEPFCRLVCHFFSTTACSEVSDAAVLKVAISTRAASSYGSAAGATFCCRFILCAGAGTPAGCR